MENNRKISPSSSSQNEDSVVIKSNKFCDEKFKTTGDPSEMIYLSDLLCRNCKNRLWENDDCLVKYWCKSCDEYGWW